MKGTKRKHRLLSILLSLMLVVGLMPAMSLTVFADRAKLTPIWYGSDSFKVITR